MLMAMLATIGVVLGGIGTVSVGICVYKPTNHIDVDSSTSCKVLHMISVILYPLVAILAMLGMVALAFMIY